MRQRLSHVSFVITGNISRKSHENKIQLPAKSVAAIEPEIALCLRPLAVDSGVKI